MKLFFQLVFAVCVIGMVGACKNDKKVNKAEVADKQEVKEVMGASAYPVSLTESSIAWEGSKPTGKHNGTIGLSAGSIDVENGEVVGGNFTIDMASIVNTDLDPDQKIKLEGHLKSPDFFDVATFPTATFAITKVAKLANDENATHLVYGNLKMKDAEKQIGFKANVSVDGGNVKVTTPQFVVNRADFNVKYGSKSFFDDLKDKYINDNIGMTINLMASK